MVIIKMEVVEATMLRRLGMDNSLRKGLLEQVMKGGFTSCHLLQLSEKMFLH